MSRIVTDAEAARLAEDWPRVQLRDGGRIVHPIDALLSTRSALIEALEEATEVCRELEQEVKALGGFVPLDGRSAVAVAYQAARSLLQQAHQGPEPETRKEGDSEPDAPVGQAKA